MARITLIGAGNVATHLGKALKEAGNELVQVWSRTLSGAEALAQALDAEAITSIDELSDKADVYILSVVDDAMGALVAQFPFKPKVLCHTTGSVSIDILKEASLSCGVLYPLQTFSKAKEVDFKAIPLFVEASDAETLELLTDLARALSPSVTVASSEQRRYLHIAAVFACNFSNYMYSLAEQMLDDHALPFDAIRPLILETAEKAQHFSPKNVQTGPAARHDQQTMNAHLDLLSASPKLAALYRDLSQRIGEDLL